MTDCPICKQPIARQVAELRARVSALEAENRELREACRDGLRLVEMIERNTKVIQGALKSKGIGPTTFPGVGFAPKAERIRKALAKREEAK